MSTHTQKKCAVSLLGEKKQLSILPIRRDTHCHQREGCRESYKKEDRKGAECGTDEQEKEQTNASLHRQEHQNKDSRRTCSLSLEIIETQLLLFQFPRKKKKKAINVKGRLLPKESKDSLPRSSEKNCTSTSCKRVWNPWQDEPCGCHDTSHGKRQSTRPSTMHANSSTCQSTSVL